MEKSKVIIGNHKNYMNLNDVSKYLKKANEKITSNQVIICPSSIYIPYFIKHDYLVGVQNIEVDKPFTGELSSSQVSELDVKYVIVGHSERVKNFSEEEERIHSKVLDVVNHNLNVIICIGETLEEKNLFKTEKSLKRQISTYLKDVPTQKFKNIIVAYEPVWTVGANKNLTVVELKRNVNYIKELISKLYNVDIPVVYGGSINSSNIEKFNKIESLDGFLVGEASTNIDEFLKIIEVVVNQ